MLIITYISVCILFLVNFYMFIGLLEVSGRQIVLFNKNGKKAFTPGAGMTLLIALLLSMAAMILLQQTNIVHLHFLILLFEWDPGCV